jgi:antitoxin component of RelBE/YafQ-DinJ toxin-antitoxin module
MVTTQVKFTIDTETVSRFKRRCEAGGVSMTTEVRLFMQTCRPAKQLKAQISTRPLRRKTVAEIIDVLIVIMSNEETYRDNIPEVFAQRYEDADHACNQLSEAIACLEDAF